MAASAQATQDGLNNDMKLFNKSMLYVPEPNDVRLPENFSKDI